ncbi:MAG TPA: type VI secretion system tube protein Hcp [Opitutaceae bacterium]|nr:type VI secretion system tube protein Hcp [Opitutaceae bacterium]
MTVKITDKLKIEGESSLAGYEKAIDVERLEHCVRMPMVGDKSSNSRTAGKCVHGEMVCTMRLNRAYPKLVEACAKGNSLGKVEAFMVKMTGGKIGEVMKYAMKDVYVSSVDLMSTQVADTGAEVSELPLVRVKLNYQSIGATYNWYDESGENKGSVSFDQLTGTGSNG